MSTAEEHARRTVPDATLAIRQPVRNSTAHYNRKDALLYAAGIGCDALRYTYENDPNFAPFPTLAVTFNGNPHDVTDFAQIMASGGSSLASWTAPT